MKVSARSWRVVALVLTLGICESPLLSAAEKPAEPYSFVVLGHIRSGASGKLSPLLGELLAKVRALNPNLIFLTGDMIWGDVLATRANAELVERDWMMLDKELDKLGIPVYRVPGNHDIHDVVTRDIYFRRYGKLPQAVSFRGARFILLSSSWVPQDTDPPSLKHKYIRGIQLGAEQLRFLRDELSAQRHDHVFLFMHHMLWWNKDEDVWWRDVHPLLVGRNVRAVFGGDLGPMKFSHVRRDEIDYLQTSIEGLADLNILRDWNSSRLLSQQFDNFLYVTVNGSQVNTEVRTVGEISVGNFTPQRWRSVDDYEPPLTERIRQLVNDKRRLIIFTSLGLLCFVGGVISALMIRRSKAP